MESKNENDFSDEICKGKEANQCSYTEADTFSCFKGRACTDQQSTASHAGSFSENAESESAIRSCHKSDAFEDVEMKLPWSHSTSKSSGSTGFLQKSESSDFPSKYAYIGNISQNLQLPNPHSHTQRSNEFFSCEDSKDLEENSSYQSQAEPFECSIGRVRSSFVGPVTNYSVDGQKSSALDSSSTLPNNKVSKPSSSKCSSSGAMFEPIIGMDRENLLAQSVNCSDTKQQFDKFNASFDVSYMQETPLQSQTTEGSDIVEDDVKVCDICGDAGQEEMLAICSRCSDGAEHTYCMQIMLDKVPEGDWLCEECQLKENAEQQKLDKTKTVTTTPKEPSLREKIVDGTLNPKLLTKVDSNADEAEVNKASKVISSSLLSAKRHTDDFEDSSKSRKLAIDTNAGALRIGSPRKKPALSRESSLKSMDEGKVKQANLVPSSGSQSADNSKEVTLSLSTIHPDSSRMQAQLQSPRGLLSRSATFNKNSKPKVKQLLEDAFQNQKLARESNKSVTRKGGLITKSMSFRTPSLGRSNMIESKSKMKSSNLFRVEDPSGLKQANEQNIIERKNSFKLDHPVVSSSSAAVTSLSLPKADPKNLFRGDSTSSITTVNNSYDLTTKQRDGKLNTSNTTISFAYKGSEDALVSDGCGNVNKQSSCLSSFGIHISKGKPISAERKPYQVGPKEDTAASSCIAEEPCGNPGVPLQDDLPRYNESTSQDGKTKDSSSFSPSKQIILPTGNNIRCHRCNEVGHIAQFCTASSRHVSALKASAARSSGELSYKNSKWKDAVEAISRTSHKDIRLRDQSDELSISSADLSSEVASKDLLSSSSSCVRNFSSLEGTLDGQEALRTSTADSSRTTAIINVKQHSVFSTETVCAPREANLNAISSIYDEFKMKLDMMKMSSQASVTSSGSAIPEHDYIWQGGFDVQRSGRLTNYYDGIQAHISTCASRRVFEVVNKFPRKVHLEEVPRLSSWPMQFQGKVTEDYIALYFFAKDLESYENSYKKLLDNMLKNDLALKGNVDRIELLIFPSNQLPEKSQCWNRLFFLWAVFRERRVNCSESLSGSQKKLYGASLDLEPSVQASVMAVLNKSEKTDSNGQKDKELSMCYSSPEVVNSTTVDFPLLSSLIRRGGNFHSKASFLDQKPINFHEHNQASIDDTHLFEKQASCSVPEIHSSASVSQLISLNDGWSLSSSPVTNAEISPEVKGDGTSLKEVYRDSKSEKDTQLQPCVQPIQNGFNNGKLVTLDSNTSNCREAGLTSSAADSQDTSSPSSKVLPVGSSFAEEAGAVERLLDNVTSVESDRRKEPTEKEQSSCESRSRMKCPHSNFPETIKGTSGEMSKETIQTFAGKEICLLVDGENSCKKMKSCNDVNVQTCSHGQIFEGGSSKILDLDSNFLNKKQKGVCAYDDVILDSSRTTERYLFLDDSGQVRDLKSGNSIPLQILSSDEEDVLETDVPNLELALGAEMKQSEHGVLPLLGQVRDQKNNQNKLLDHATDDGDNDLSASLSLSLSFPFSEKEQTAKSVSKTAQPLPKRHHVDTSLLLFGGFQDT